MARWSTSSPTVPPETLIELPDRGWDSDGPPVVAQDFATTFVIWHEGVVWHRQVPKSDPSIALYLLRKSEVRRRNHALPKAVLRMLRECELLRRKGATGMFDLWFTPFPRDEPLRTFGAAFVTVEDINATGIWWNDIEDL